MPTLDLKIDELAGHHRNFLKHLRSAGETAVTDFAKETLPDLISAVGPKSERHGKAIVTADILKVVQPVNHGAVEPATVGTLVGRYRQNGRVRRGPAKRFRVKVGDFIRYRDEKHEKVGYTGGGWTTAARELGVDIPDWMTDEHGRGSIEIVRSTDRFRVRMANEVPWVDYRGGRAVRLKTGIFHALLMAAFQQAKSASRF